MNNVPPVECLIQKNWIICRVEWGGGGDILQCLPHSKSFLAQFGNSSTREWHDFVLIAQSCLDHAIIITIHILLQFKKVALVNWIICLNRAIITILVCYIIIPR